VNTKINLDYYYYYLNFHVLVTGVLRDWRGGGGAAAGAAGSNRNNLDYYYYYFEFSRTSHWCVA